MNLDAFYTRFLSPYLQTNYGKWNSTILELVRSFSFSTRWIQIEKKSKLKVLRGKELELIGG